MASRYAREQTLITGDNFELKDTVLELNLKRSGETRIFEVNKKITKAGFFFFF